MLSSNNGYFRTLEKRRIHLPQLMFPKSFLHSNSHADLWQYNTWSCLLSFVKQWRITIQTTNLISPSSSLEALSVLSGQQHNLKYLGTQTYPAELSALKQQTWSLRKRKQGKFSLIQLIRLGSHHSKSCVTVQNKKS